MHSVTVARGVQSSNDKQHSGGGGRPPQASSGADADAIAPLGRQKKRQSNCNIAFAPPHEKKKVLAARKRMESGFCFLPSPPLQLQRGPRRGIEIGA
eukprot:scaffold42570_cov31-Tisochrysis_lutea.AAC.3